MKIRNSIVIQTFLIGIVVALLSIGLLYPISLNMGTMISDRWDGLTQSWRLAWCIEKMRYLFDGLWDANIFFPHRLSLAYGEHLLGQAILVFPLYFLTKNPILTHNAFTFLSFVLAGIGMFLLSRKITDDFRASLISALIFAFLPWRIAHIDTINMHGNQWLPFVLWAFHQFIETDKKKYLLYSIVFYVLNFLCSIYHALMVTVALIIIFLYLCASNFEVVKRKVMGLVAATIVASLLIVPTFLPYKQLADSQGTKRKIEDAIKLSADPLDYLRAPPWNRTWGGITTPLENRYSISPGENRLFFGLMTFILAIYGAGTRKKEKKKFWNIYAVVAITAFLFSLGPFLHIGWRKYSIPLPYLIAYKLVPGFSAMRAPARFGAMVGLSAALLASIGTKEFIDKSRSKKNANIKTLILGIAIFLESFSAPIPHYSIETGDKIPTVYNWLAKVDTNDTILEIPQYLTFDGIKDGEKTAGDPLGYRYAYFSIYHKKKILNGRSSFIPPTTIHLLEKINNPPDEKLVAVLKSLGIKYVIVHTTPIHWRQDSDIISVTEGWLKYAQNVRKFGEAIVYELSPSTEEVFLGWQKVLLESFVFPPKIKNGAKANLELVFKAPDSNPVYSFALAKLIVECETNIKNKQISYHRNFLMIDPGETQIETFTFTAPPKNGIYIMNCEITIQMKDEKKFSISYPVTVGNFPDTLTPHVLKANFKELKYPKTVHKNEEFVIKSKVENSGDTYWRAYPFADAKNMRGVVSLAVRDWYSPNGTKIPLHRAPISLRGYLQKSVMPGENTTISVKVKAPSIAGKYILLLDLVDEHIVWFEDAGYGSKAERLEIEVLP